MVTTTPATEAVPVNNLDTTGGDAQLEVSVVGVSLQAHHVRVTLNGTEVGTLDFAGATHETQTFTVPAALLHDGDNTVQFAALGGGPDTSLVDLVRLTYAHKYNADNGVLSVGIDNEETRRVGGFTSPNIRAVDITDPRRVIEVTSTVAVTPQPDGTYAADLQVLGASFRRPHTVLVFVDGVAEQPAAVEPNEPSSWWSQTAGADYLIITNANFVSQVEPLAALRRSQGLVVKVIDVEDVYDEFSFGSHTPQALRDLLQTAQNTWTRKPQFVLLAGDASFDPKNYLGQGQTDFVPTKLFDTALMETASDDWVADFNDDGVADLAIGRLPIRTTADADLMIGKILSYEAMAPDPQRGALLVADNGFEGQSSAAQSLLPPAMPVQVINRSSSDDQTIHTRLSAASIRDRRWSISLVTARTAPGPGPCSCRIRMRHR